MRPKKAKYLIPIIATNLNIPEQVVEAVVLHYWEEVRKALSGLSHQRIHLTNLGDFYIKHWKLDEKISSLEKWEESNKQKGMQQITARFKTAEMLFDLKALKKIMDEERQRKDFISLHKIKNNESKN